MPHQMDWLVQQLAGDKLRLRLKVLAGIWRAAMTGPVRGDQVPTLRQRALRSPRLPTAQDDAMD